MPVINRVDAVRVYPSGGVICTKVAEKQCQSIGFAVLQLRNGIPALIALKDLCAVRVAWESVQEEREARKAYTVL